MALDKLGGALDGVLRMVEFYSGIGGWSFALRSALECTSQQASISVVAAYDFSTVCNDVYSLNFPSGTKPSQRPIERLDASALDGKADVWVMSPPCQPHTRQRKGLEDQSVDEADPRSQSFLHLCGLLAILEAPPATLVLENVVGFEASKSCATLLAALGSRGYIVQQFHLSPTQFSFPNERPRYYLVATRSARASEDGLGEQPHYCLQATLPRAKKRKLSQGYGVEVAEAEMEATVAFEATAVPSRDVGAYLELPVSYDSAKPSSSDSTGGYDGGNVGGVVDGTVMPAWLSDWSVSPALLAKDAAWCFDIVRHTGARTACFTSSYGRFVKGTGSVLFVPNTGAARDGTGVAAQAAGDGTPALAGARPFERPGEQPQSGPDALLSPEAREFGDSWRAQVGRAGTLRYFTPREVANLMGFPPSFVFPDGLKPRKAYELLGNSLHVGVAAKVLAVALGLA